MTIIKTPWGGRSRFVLTLFSDVNKTGTNHEHPKCCKIVTLLHTGHRPSVAKLSHCCRWDTLLQDCHTVADRQRWTNCVYNVAHWKNSSVRVCVYVQRLLRAFARYKFLLCLISRLHISDRYSENIWQTPLPNIFAICLLNGHTASYSAIYVFRYVPTRHMRHGHSLAILGHALGT